MGSYANNIILKFQFIKKTRVLNCILIRFLKGKERNYIPI